MLSWMARQIGGHPPIGRRDVMARLHLEGQWDAARARADADAKLRALAEREAIVPSQDMLQRAVDDYRDRRGLHSKDETASWLAEAGLRLNQLVEFVRRRLQYDVMLAAIPTSALRTWFEEHRQDYDAALLSVCSFGSESDAWIARTAAEQSPEAFHDLTWSRPQADPNLPLGGALGWRLRRQLPPGIASRVFDESGDGLVGPILGGSTFYVYRVWERRPASWTPAVELQCRQDYLADQIRSVSLP